MRPCYFPGPYIFKDEFILLHIYTCGVQSIDFGRHAMSYAHGWEHAKTTIPFSLSVAKKKYLYTKVAKITVRSILLFHYLDCLFFYNQLAENVKKKIFFYKIKKAHFDWYAKVDCSGFRHDITKDKWISRNLVNEKNDERYHYGRDKRATLRFSDVGCRRLYKFFFFLLSQKLRQWRGPENRANACDSRFN